jgi:hypothetical protein
VVFLSLGRKKPLGGQVFASGGGRIARKLKN